MGKRFFFIFLFSSSFSSFSLFPPFFPFIPFFPHKQNLLSPTVGSVQFNVVVKVGYGLIPIIRFRFINLDIKHIDQRLISQPAIAEEHANEINNDTHKSTYLTLPKYCQDLESN